MAQRQTQITPPYQPRALGDSAGDVETFFDILDGFDTAMLTTHAPERSLRSRPMRLGGHDRDGKIWFATRLGTTKVSDVLRDPRVNVSMQSSSAYLSISGRATVVTDAELIRELWSPTWSVWFPDGPDDPELTLIEVTAQRGDYWDLSIGNAVVFLLEAGRSVLTGRQGLRNDTPLHESVEFRTWSLDHNSTT